MGQPGTQRGCHALLKGSSVEGCAINYTKHVASGEKGHTASCITFCLNKSPRVNMSIGTVFELFADRVGGLH